MSEVGYMAHRQKMLHTPAIKCLSVENKENGIDTEIHSKTVWCISVQFR